MKRQVQLVNRDLIISIFNAKEHHILTLDLIKIGYIYEDDMRIFDYDNLFNKYMENGITYKKLIKVLNYTCYRVIDRSLKMKKEYQLKINIHI